MFVHIGEYELLRKWMLNVYSHLNWSPSSSLLRLPSWLMSSQYSAGFLQLYLTVRSEQRSQWPAIRVLEAVAADGSHQRYVNHPRPWDNLLSFVCNLRYISIPFAYSVFYGRDILSSILSYNQQIALIYCYGMLKKT